MEARRASQPAYPFQLSLRVRHPSIDPAAISRELQIEPEHCFRAGDPRESARNVSVTPVHVDSYWLATLDLSTLLLGKALATRIIPELASPQDPKLTHDSSTNTLIRRHRQHRKTN